MVLTSGDDPAWEMGDPDTHTHTTQLINAQRFTERATITKL